FPAADLETTLAAVRDTARQGQQAVDTVIAAGEAALRMLPDVFGHELRAALARLRRVFDDAMADLAALIAQAGSPEALRAAGAVATASTAVGAPVGVTIAIAAVGATAVAVNEAPTDLTSITTDIRDQAAGLQRRLSNDTAFPAGRWPRSATPISGDGSIGDGD